MFNPNPNPPPAEYAQNIFFIFLQIVYVTFHQSTLWILCVLASMHFTLMHFTLRTVLNADWMYFADASQRTLCTMYTFLFPRQEQGQGEGQTCHAIGLLLPDFVVDSIMFFSAKCVRCNGQLHHAVLMSDLSRKFGFPANAALMYFTLMHFILCRT